MREEHTFKNWIDNLSEYLKNNWDIDTKRMSPSIQRDFKEFNQGRYAIIGGFALLLIYFRFWSLILSIVLIIWGYKRCKMVYPKLKNELEFYKKETNNSKL